MFLVGSGLVGAQLSVRCSPDVRSCCTLAPWDIPGAVALLSACRSTAFVLPYPTNARSGKKYAVVGTQIHHVRSGGIKIICFQTGISWREPQPDDRAG